jgi:two-component system sensor histidine kinase MprB
MRLISLRKLSLRARVALLAAVAVTGTIIFASIVSFTVFTGKLRAEIDQSLISQAQSLGDNSDGLPGDRHDTDLLATLGLSFAAVKSGVIIQIPGSRALAPVDMAVVRQVSKTGGPEYVLHNARSGDIDMRVVTMRARDKSVIVLAQSLAQVDRTVARLGAATVVVGLGAVVLAATGGIAVAGAGLSPVRRLTRATAHITRTQQLNTAPIEVVGNDEIAQLGESFNAMLAALERSRQRQRQLVADAGHELRTPLTSLRANIDLLIQTRRHPERTLPHGSLDALLTDVSAQLQELSTLVDDLVGLSRDDEQFPSRGDVRFDQVVRHAIDRVQRRDPTTTFSTDLRPWLVYGLETELERAVTNLLDNAVKFSPAEGTVRIVLVQGELTVADEGPGIAEMDLPQVFERFYRSAEARALPGAGLGLAIVRHAAEHHGGVVIAENRPTGGALMRLTLPGTPPA